MGETRVSMKLLINSQTNKVLFAEAGKDCVDFLFHILSLPLATVIRLLREQGMVGCLVNMYQSVENLNDSYIQPDQNKDAVLKPMVTTSVPLFLLHGSTCQQQPSGKVIYRCGGYCHSYYSDDSRAICRNCNTKMNQQMTYVAPPPSTATVKKEGVEGGFVKGVVTYMVTDDLVVKPMSTISSIVMLNQFNVKDVSILKEKEVRLGMKEAVKLLRTCLHSKKVLTEVFLNN